MNEDHDRFLLVVFFGGLHQRNATATLTIAISDSKHGDGPLGRERGKLVLGTVIGFDGGLRQRGAAAAALTIAISDSKDGDGPLGRERGKLVLGTVIRSYGGLRQRGAAAAALTIAIFDSKDGDGPLRRERRLNWYWGLSLALMAASVNVAPPPPL